MEPCRNHWENPCALSFSLYETLITDKAWSSAREIMGYNAPVGRPLMYAIAGQPYIDVRLSFNSLPKNLPNKISTKLIDKYISTLINNPHLHDKVEFDVMITSYCFNFDYKIDCLVGSVLSNEEKTIYKSLLKEQTNKLISRKGRYSIASSMEKIYKLQKIQLNKRVYDEFSIFPLIHEIITLGTIPFSILARHAFIAKAFLQSMKDLKIISISDYDRFLGSLITVATELYNDTEKLYQKQILINEFMEKYGHLRPGTYEIRSPRYDALLNFNFGIASIIPKIKIKKNSYLANLN